MFTEHLVCICLIFSMSLLHWLIGEMWHGRSFELIGHAGAALEMLQSSPGWRGRLWSVSLEPVLDPPRWC